MDPLSQSERDNVISLIGRPSSPQDRFDPCAVREVTAAKLNKATYLIAIAARCEENF